MKLFKYLKENPTHASYFVFIALWTIIYYTPINTPVGRPLLKYSIAGVSVVFLLIKVLHTRYTGREYAIAVIIGAILFISLLSSHRVSFAVAFAAIFASKDIDFNKTLKTILSVGALSFFTCILVHLVRYGFYGSVRKIRYIGSLRLIVSRNSLGYSHANYVYLIFMVLVIGYLYLNWKKTKAWFWIGSFVVGLLLFYLTFSRTGAATLALAVLFYIILTRWPVGFMRGLLRTLPVASIILSFVLVFWHWIYPRGLIQVINKTLTGRLYWSHEFLTFFTPKLFGQNVDDISGYSLSYLKSDNSYVLMLCAFGIIVFTLFVIFTIMLSRKKLALKDYFMLSIFYLYCIMESTVTIIYLNFALFLFTNLLFSQDGANQSSIIDFLGKKRQQTLSKSYLKYSRKNSQNLAGSKAPSDVEKILDSLGFAPLTVTDSIGAPKFKKAFIVFINWCAILFWLPKGSTFFVQIPIQGAPIAGRFLPILKKLKKCYLICIIHDLDSFRPSVTNNKSKGLYTDRVILKMFDALICHNETMKTRLINELDLADKNIIPLGIFDYLQTQENCAAIINKPFSENPLSIAIAGNCSNTKSPYLYKLPSLGDEILFDFYGPNFSSEDMGSYGDYKGSLLPDELPCVLNETWGLVWDGTEIGTCAGETGEYLRLNNPHKASLYVASGIPIIIWRQSALASFVENEGIGLCIESLSEINSRLKNISAEEYQTLKRNVGIIGGRLREGWYTRKALETILTS